MKVNTVKGYISVTTNIRQLRSYAHKKDKIMTHNSTQSEYRLQADCFQWFHNTYPQHRQMLFHVQNKAVNAIEGNRFKAMGVVKGISDLILIISHHVIFIELKTEEGRLAPEQREFGKKVIERGHRYMIIRSLVSFQELVISLLNPYTQDSAPTFIN